MAQQVPLPRSSSSYPDNQPRYLEQLEPETEDYMDVRDFSERPADDKRPPKPPWKPEIMLQNLIPPPGCPDYVVMNAAVAEILKPQHTEIRGILPEKKKVTQGMDNLLKEVTPKKWLFMTMTCMQWTQKTMNTTTKSPRRKRHKKNMGQKKRIWGFFYKLNVKDNVDLANTPCEEEYTDENYELVEERETAM